MCEEILRLWSERVIRGRLSLISGPSVVMGLRSLVFAVRPFLALFRFSWKVIKFIRVT